jgi:hypothetical protein
MLLLAWHLHEMPCTGQGLTAHVTWDSVEGELQVGLGSFEKQAHVGEHGRGRGLHARCA